MKIKDGEKIIYSFVLTQEDINKFAEYSGDYQKIHINGEFAKKTIFERLIAHGFLSMMPVTKILGMDIIEENEYIALKKINVEFFKPIYPGDKITLELMLHEEERPNHYLVSVCWQKNQDIVMTGSIPIVILKIKEKVNE